MSNKNRTSRTQFRAVRMPVELDDQLKRASEQLGVSRSQIIVEALSVYLWEADRRGVITIYPDTSEEGGRD